MAYLIQNTVTNVYQEVEMVPATLNVNEVNRGSIPAGISPGTAIWNGTSIVADLTSTKRSMKALLKTIRLEKQLSGFTYSGKTIQTDFYSRENIRAQRTRALDATTSLLFPIQFRTLDNTSLTLTATDMIALHQALAVFDAAIHDNTTALRAAIDAATTSTELVAINLYSGWPA